MGIRTFSRPLMQLAALVSISFSGATFALGESTGDYRDYTFSSQSPYFYQDGKVDFGTYNGFRRYHSECHVCHGPAGVGSSYAPSLLAAVRVLNFHEFVDVIVRGRVGQENFVMPGFASNMNVLPYLHDIYAYLMARSAGVIGVNRPNRFPKRRMAGMSGMSGMAGMSGMGGMIGSGMAGMGTMLGMNGAYITGPDGSVYLFPAEMGGRSHAGGIASDSRMGGTRGLYRVGSDGLIYLQPMSTDGMGGRNR